ncbi:MAG: HAD family hydrolase [Clostridia bacterium]|nr:HAD family hydrolase [Clostridia bacterium]
MNGPLCMGQTMRALHPDMLAMKRPVLIVFDLDGTLTDSEDLGRQLFKRVFARLGFGEISDALADSFNGPSSDEVCRIMGIEDRKDEYNALIDEIETELVRTQGIVFPGVTEMLRSLAPHAHLAILTNGSPAYCSACIEEYGFAPYISLQAGFASGVTKAMRIGMWERELGVRRVIVVGDRRTDITNARAAGAYAIGVTFGMGSVEELMDADSLCDSAQEVTRACLRVIAEV